MGQTAAVVLLAIAILIVYDVIAYTRGWQTISQLIWSLSARHAWFPFLAGFLLGFVCGHLFWPG